MRTGDYKMSNLITRIIIEVPVDLQEWADQEEFANTLNATREKTGVKFIGLEKQMHGSVITIEANGSDRRQTGAIAKKSIEMHLDAELRRRAAEAKIKKYTEDMANGLLVIFNVKVNLVKAIVGGKKGERLKEITNETKASIRVNADSGQVVIAGKTRESVSKARTLIDLRQEYCTLSREILERKIKPDAIRKCLSSIKEKAGLVSITVFQGQIVLIGTNKAVNMGLQIMPAEIAKLTDACDQDEEASRQRKLLRQAQKNNSMGFISRSFSRDNRDSRSEIGGNSTRRGNGDSRSEWGANNDQRSESGQSEIGTTFRDFLSRSFTRDNWDSGSQVGGGKEFISRQMSTDDTRSESEFGTPFRSRHLNNIAADPSGDEPPPLLTASGYTPVSTIKEESRYDDERVGPIQKSPFISRSMTVDPGDSGYPDTTASKYRERETESVKEGSVYDDGNRKISDFFSRSFSKDPWDQVVSTKHEFISRQMSVDPREDVNGIRGSGSTMDSSVDATTPEVTTVKWKNRFDEAELNRRREASLAEGGANCCVIA